MSHNEVEEREYFKQRTKAEWKEGALRQRRRLASLGQRILVGRELKGEAEHSKTIGGCARKSVALM